MNITARYNNREFFPIPLPLCWEIFSDYLYLVAHGFKIDIYSFVMMSNHFHLLCRDPHGQISKAMEFFMRETSREISRIAGRINRIWGRPFHNTVIGSPLYFLHSYKYNYRNPIAAGLVDRVEDYPWSTLQILLGNKSGIIPLTYDETLFSDVEGTLVWLNESYTDTQSESLKKAFKRKEFEIASEQNNKYANPLTKWDSVPEFMRCVPKSWEVPLVEAKQSYTN